MINMAEWTQYGILGLVIGSLFLVIAIGFKMFLRFIERIQDDFKEVAIEMKKQHSEDIARQEMQHREERKKWAMESDRREERYMLSMKEFSQAIRDLRDKI